MARLHPNPRVLSNATVSEVSSKCRRLNLILCGERDNQKNIYFSERKRGDTLKTLVSSSPSPSSVVKIEESDEYEYLASEFGWKVRRLFESDDEMKRVAFIQAQAFHEPLVLFNDLFFIFFQAEVLSGLIYKLKNSPPSRYTCLVARPIDDSSENLVGAVDITVMSEASVLEQLEGVDEYLYVSGIAVLNDFRRRKVATVLLKACDVVSSLWGYGYLVLRAYEDDDAARTLYTNAGYKVVSRDPPWMSTWIGRKRRVLMIKRSSKLIE